MEHISIYLRAQNEAHVQIEQRQRDGQNARWTDEELYNAINDCIGLWSQSVRVPFLYTITNGFVSGTYEYSLPAYVRQPLDVQQLRRSEEYYNLGAVDTTTTTWVDAPAYRLEPDGSGGQKLRLEYVPITTDARVIFWAPNGLVPTTIPTLNTTLTSSDTSVIIDATPEIGDVGYVKIESEWMSYVGIARGTSTTTLQNVTRGLNYTTAAAHTSGVSVYWGIATHRLDVYQHMQIDVMASANELFLSRAAPEEREHHVFMVRYYKQMSSEFWRKFTPSRASKMILARGAIGPLW
jgi:hypothetical protein